MTSFEDRFAAARVEGRSALFPYMMCGLFDDEATVDLFCTMAAAGADGFEIGIPYADPLMDGPVIQEAGARALGNGMTLSAGLGLAGRVAAATERPCAVMTYVNPILAMGPSQFAERVAAAGLEAVILADLPVDESQALAAGLDDAGVGLVLFAAPTTTDERLEAVVARSRPFVYAVAEMGVTGERTEQTDHAARLVGRIRAVSDIPVVLGVGISGAEQARAAATIGDGVIVGSALVRRVLEADDPTEATESVGEAVSVLAAAVRN